jgi:hypothetical protein
MGFAAFYHPTGCRVTVSAHREAVAAALQARQTSLKHFAAVRNIDKLQHNTYRCAPPILRAGCTTLPAANNARQNPVVGIMSCAAW